MDIARGTKKTASLVPMRIAAAESRFMDCAQIPTMRSTVKISVIPVSAVV